jgi:hypothetical protein
MSETKTTQSLGIPLEIDVAILSNLPLLNFMGAFVKMSLYILHHNVMYSCNECFHFVATA